MHYTRHSRWPRPRLTLTLIVCAALMGLLVPVTRAAGMTFTVSKTDDTFQGSCDPGNCSLRDAIYAANANSGADTIVLPSGVYTLALGGSGEDNAQAGDLDIHDSVTITGTLARAADTVVMGGASWGDRIFEVFAGASVSINGITIQDGNASAAGGGGILNQGTLALDASAVSGNTATSGGGI